MAVEFDDGRYLAKVIDQQLTTAKTSGNAQVVLVVEPRGQWDAQSQEYLELTTELQNKKRTIYLTITETTAERRMAELETLASEKGLAFESWGQVDLTAPNAVDLREAECECTMRAENYNGRSNERWDLLIEKGRREIPKVESSTVRRLDAAFGWSKRKKSTPAPPTPGEQPAF